MKKYTLIIYNFLIKYSTKSILIINSKCIILTKQKGKIKLINSKAK